MATVRAYTTIEQSRKLATILPLESADMFYNEEPEDESYPKDIVDTKYPMVLRGGQKHFLEEYGIPCWSLAAMLNILPEYNLQRTDWGNKTEYKIVVTTDEDNYASKNYDNAVDACVDMVMRLNELNLL